jgi:hypothetical protein
LLLFFRKEERIFFLERKKQRTFALFGFAAGTAQAKNRP